jgi:transposase
LIVSCTSRANKPDEEERLAGVNVRRYGSHHRLSHKWMQYDFFIACIAGAGAQAVIPARKTRREPRLYDRHAYRERHLIECFFSRLKQFRRIATRYEKLARNFLSMLNLAMAYIWLA